MRASFAPTSATITTCGTEGASIWHLATGERITRLTWDGPLHETAILQYDKSGERLGLVTDSWFRLWHVSGASQLAFHPFEEGERGLAVVFANDEIICFVCRSYSTPLESDVKPLTVSHPRRDIHLTQVVVNYHGTRFPLVSADGGVALVCVDVSARRYELWSLKDGRCTAQFQFEPHMATHFSLSPDNRFLAQGYHHRPGVTIWETYSGKIVREIQTDKLTPRICYSRTHDLLATVINNPWSNVDRTRFIDPLKGDVLGWTSGHGMMLTTNYLFSPRGRWFASGIANNAAPSQVTPTPGGTVALTDVGPIMLLETH